MPTTNLNFSNQKSLDYFSVSNTNCCFYFPTQGYTTIKFACVLIIMGIFGPQKKIHACWHTYLCIVSTVNIFYLNILYIRVVFICRYIIRTIYCRNGKWIFLKNFRHLSNVINSNEYSVLTCRSFQLLLDRRCINCVERRLSF